MGPKMPTQLPLGAPRALQRAYTLWLRGEDTRMLYGRTSWRELQRRLLSYGVDITKERPSPV